jgi:hypothetical protein
VDTSVSIYIISNDLTEAVPATSTYSNMKTKSLFQFTFFTDADRRKYGIMEAPKLDEVSQDLKTKSLIEKRRQKRSITCEWRSQRSCYKG